MTPRIDAAFRRASRRLFTALLVLAAPAALADVTITETFTGANADGWVFGGNYTPTLTASTVDSDGTGWLRLTDADSSVNNQATYALFDTELFSVNAQIQIEIEYAFYNGGNEGPGGFPFAPDAVGDGITFFLVDGSVDASTFSAGAYGGSLGYANMDSTPGMSGGYLGFGFDNFGNYAAANEGKEGGVDLSTGAYGTPNGDSRGLSVGDRDAAYSNVIGVRGPESSGYEYIASSLDADATPLPESMYVDSTTRPDQTGADYRSFRLTLDANNQLLVEMKFGADGDWITAFTADLSTFDRPETFKIGFTAGTGGAWSTQEIRNVQVTTTPWSTGSGAYEWDNDAGTTAWGATPGGANTNWHASDSASDNLTPVARADVLFGDKPTNNGPTNTQHVALSSDVSVRNLTIDSHINYSIGTVGDGRVITFGKGSDNTGLPSLNVNDYNGSRARHKINSDILLTEKLAIQNYSYSILCLNGEFDTAGHAVTVNGTGAVNFNGAILGSGDLTKNGSGITTINANNAATWTGDVVVNAGQLVVTADGALGAAGGTSVSLVNQTTSTTTAAVSAAGGPYNGNFSVVGVAAGTLQVGMTVTGSGVPAGTTILWINAPDANGVQAMGLSNGVTGSGTFTFTGGGTTSVATGGSDPVGTVTSTNSSSTTTNITRAVQVGNQSNLSTLTVESWATPPGGFQVGQSVTGSNVPAGTTITAITPRSGGGYDLTLSQPTTAYVSWQSLSFAFTYTATTATTIVATTVQIPVSTTLPGGSTIVNDGGTLTFRGGVDYATAEGLTLSGQGVEYTSGKHLGAIYNDGSDNSFAGSITLAADSAVGSRDGTLVLSGVVRGDHSLTKLGAGSVSLTGANTYTGDTLIQGGALRVTTDSLPGGYDTTDTASNFGAVKLDGGVLELASATSFTRRLGTGEEQISWTGDGGFSAYGGDRVVSLVNSDGVANGQLAWGAGHFVPTGNALLLSSGYADGTVTLTNAIDLGALQREVRVADGSAAVDGALAGALTGTGGLVKTGEGTLALTSAGNTYSGATEIRAGALRGNVSTASNLQLAGGVRELSSSSATITLGDSAGQVRWIGDGGFAAHGDHVTLALDVPGTTDDSLTWGGAGATAHFVAADNKLVLGSRGADKTLTLANNLALAGATGDTRTIKAVRGTDSTIASGALSGVVSGAATLAVTGDGRLDLTADNTHTGAITVTGAELRLSGASGDLAQSSGFTVRQGGTLTLDNSAALRDRVGDSASVSLSGGTLALSGRDAAGGDLAEDVGALSLARGANTVRLTRANDDSFVRLSADSLVRSAGATVDFSVTGGTLGDSTGVNSANNPRVTFTAAAPALDDGILAYATINGADFATYGANGIAAATYSAANQNSWSGSTNLSTTSNLALTASRNLNSLRLASGADLDLGGHQLAVESGGILTVGFAGTVISNGLLTTNNTNEFVVHAYDTGGTTLSAVVGGSGGLTKSGDGSLTLSGATANTNTGVTTVNAGALVLAKSDGVAAVAGDLVVGDGRGADSVSLAANEQIADTATVTLRGGEVGNASDVASFSLNGAASDTFASRIESFATLKIEGNGVLDFGGGTVCSPTFLFLDSLDVAGDALLTITDWIEYTDFLLVAKATFDSEDLGRVVFDGYDNAATWQDYDSAYYQIVPHAAPGNTPTLPVPEPAATGALALGGLTGMALLRRRRRA